MATSTPPLLILILMAAIATAASARPCKTLFFITSSTLYTIPQNQNPNPNPNPRYFTIFFTSTSNIGPRVRRDHHFTTRFKKPINFDSPLLVNDLTEEEETRSLSSAAVAVPSSIRDRTKDIMGVVAALLLGMGCGVLTAATMYLIWSLFMPNRFEFDDSDDENDADAKKMGGYMAIPSKFVDHDDDLKKAVVANVNVPVAKEVV